MRINNLGFDGSKELFDLFAERYDFLIFLDGYHVKNCRSVFVSAKGFVEVPVDGKFKRQWGDVKLILRSKRSFKTFQISEIIKKDSEMANNLEHSAVNDDEENN